MCARVFKCARKPLCVHVGVVCTGARLSVLMSIHSYTNVCAHACVSGHKLSSVHVKASVCILVCVFKCPQECVSELMSVCVDTRVLCMHVCELCAHRSVCRSM